METKPDFRRSIAIVIGIDTYSNGIPPLSTAANDARVLADRLENDHGYDVRLLCNEEATMERVLALLTKELPTEIDGRDSESEDRVLFYFGGHGVALDSDEGPKAALERPPVQDGRSLGELATPRPGQTEVVGVRSIAFSPDGETLASRAAATGRSASGRSRTPGPWASPS